MLNHWLYENYNQWFLFMRIICDGLISILKYIYLGILADYRYLQKFVELVDEFLGQIYTIDK
mgnify:CR=1 FL=1